MSSFRKWEGPPRAPPTSQIRSHIKDSIEIAGGPSWGIGKFLHICKLEWCTFIHETVEKTNWKWNFLLKGMVVRVEFWFFYSYEFYFNNNHHGNHMCISKGWIGKLSQGKFDMLLLYHFPAIVKAPEEPKTATTTRTTTTTTAIRWSFT